MGIKVCNIYDNNYLYKNDNSILITLVKGVLWSPICLKYINIILLQIVLGILKKLRPL